MRSVAINTGPDTHLDHLGVLAALLEIPFIVTDKKHYELAQIFYPQVQTQFIEPEELTLDFLAAHFDLLFGCGKYWYMELFPLLQLFHQKNMRFVFCPHGNSDKGATLTDSSHPPQDIALMYGEHMRDLLHRTGALSRVKTSIITGNLRYPFYRNHRQFYDGLAEKRIFSKFDPKKRTILYAPTWSSTENPTTFYETCLEVIQQLSSDYNLLIKPHPFLEEEQPAHFVHLQSLCEQVSHSAFVTDFPAIYPLLAKADIYLGDFSSVGYDFLAFDKPLYFFNLTKTMHPPLLYQCGMEIPSSMHRKIGKFLESTLEKNNDSPKRREIYHYVFGIEKTGSAIKDEILLAASPAQAGLVET